ncbi:MAG: hypothetical protein JXR51_02900 [Bacteroidales bacterium]|nr:hypothetical protein [Bacteroidales bacterium]MBN2756098.1 hypothetical protein [Bacteroidales bacterium]
MNTIIDNCLIILNDRFDDKIEIRREYLAENSFVKSQEAKLHQAFLNILINAEQSIKKKGLITIKTENENKFIKISILDTGCGIEQNKLSHIIEPFYTTKEPGKGIGLGLTIAYNNIKDNFGDLKFISKVSSGTTVIIKLPFLT